MASRTVSLELVGRVTAGLGSPLQRSHLSVPTPWFDAATGRLRLFVSSRDGQGVSRVFVADLDPGNPAVVLASRPRPVLDLGKQGHFDANGILCTDVRREAGGALRMLYAGFETYGRGRYRLLTGSGISSDGGDTFDRESEAPLLATRPDEVTVRGAAVFGEHLDPKLSGGVVYAGGSGWVATAGGRMRPRYSLKYQDLDVSGLEVDGCARALLEPGSGEHGFGRTGAVQIDGSTCVLLSVRVQSTGSYRLEMADVTEQGDLVRVPDAIDVRLEGTSLPLDGLMFAASVTIGDETWVFLNGPNYGEHGVLVARLRNG